MTKFRGKRPRLEAIPPAIGRIRGNIAAVRELVLRGHRDHSAVGVVGIGANTRDASVDPESVHARHVAVLVITYLGQLTARVVRIGIGVKVCIRRKKGPVRRIVIKDRGTRASGSTPDTASCEHGRRISSEEGRPESLSATRRSISRVRHCKRRRGSCAQDLDPDLRTLRNTGFHLITSVTRRHEKLMNPFRSPLRSIPILDQKRRNPRRGALVLSTQDEISSAEQTPSRTKGEKTSSRWISARRGRSTHAPGIDDNIVLILPGREIRGNCAVHAAQPDLTDGLTRESSS